MFAVELSFTVDRVGVPPSTETVEASVLRNGCGGRTRLEHLRVRRIAQAMFVVAFLAARTAGDASDFARRIGWQVSAELRHLQYIGQRVWTGDDF
ncbi:hypothetical protein BX285_1397 [Streptomyces sp. 1114.5]|uniref:hypothetical protein n=1 Tax=unclassified Streptomyces TaxID=2593676 RepID=UPI000BC60026|nr:MULTISPECIES: hypothetical protein [unclassified Streptomyces]RKT17033.1 hypothetical protein BX285_1397 [Streptomyces sp. 1114.5]SOB83244.1 hypothetical protein SAMN06272789_3446 [Streptomyces sp. 1331.2]